MKTFFSHLSADAQLILSGIVNLAGNSLIIAALPSFLPHGAVLVIFLVFNVAQVLYAFANPSYAVHLIQTGQMKVPPAPIATVVATTVTPKPVTTAVATTVTPPAAPAQQQ